MPAITAAAPGKIILFGEHAVVYGRPAIAVPVLQVKAKCIITPNLHGEPGQINLYAPGIGLKARYDQLPDSHPLAFTVHTALSALELKHIPAMNIRVTSTIPPASGLGSGAAVAVAVLRALPGFLGYPLSDEQVCALAYQVEKLHHGTPSGIDNTVITYAMPVFFIKDRPIQTFLVPQPFTLVIADTGVRSSTRLAVAGVRKAWEESPDTIDPIFDRIAQLVIKARQSIEGGSPLEIGPLMDENHRLLQRIGVSSPELDHLVSTAQQAGALGAKLSGAGLGGNLIALVEPDQAPVVAQALVDAGAKRTIITEVKGGNDPG